MWLGQQPQWGVWDSRSYCYREGLRVGAGSGPGSGVTVQRTASQGQDSSPLPHGTSRNQPDATCKLLLATTVGHSSGHPPSTPSLSSVLYTVHSATRRAGRAKRLSQAPQLSEVPHPHFSSTPCDLHVSQPHWDNSVPRTVIRKQRGVLPTLESPGWASNDPLHPSGRPPSFLFCCLFFKGELNTLTKQETQPQHQPRPSHSHTLQSTVPSMGAQGTQLLPSVLRWVPHAYLSLRLSPHTQHQHLFPDVDLPTGLRTLGSPQRDHDFSTH